MRPPVPKKMVPNKIKLGNRPLQGRKALVSTARSRSRGESMIRHPVTPAALQPRPMHMVRACLPQAHRANPRSRRKATRGKYPHILQESKEWEKNGHRRQHHSHHPGHGGIDPIQQRAGQIPRQAPLGSQAGQPQIPAVKQALEKLGRGNWPQRRSAIPPPAEEPASQEAPLPGW